ncbi:MAG TPA: ParB/RepB/Spo0J family partition protein [Candidatus Butyricicoccus avistercoris]|uniref:ParB/RepB/Spo0J family partition protein n=1 Tax=Candidatus Butyricicoccus avistercoris TaxID=2838518 RepID=A0A9D1PHT6_9FIRM|nr:ParB/RepB/Spo0J family partition protein [Candidatus Butyricicoccus avistercoris]
MSKFDLAAILKDEDVFNLNTLEIVNIKCSQIKTNDENFFEVANVDELAESIELIGLQQPLVVTKSSNGYLLIAGHRRFAAIKSLGWETVPCIISSQANSELETLALIQTNTQTRELTYAERVEAVKRTKEALISLKEKGFKFNGRLRDKIAEITKESPSEIGKMQAIEKNLSNEGKEMLTDGELSPSVAYEMSKMPEQKQKAFTEKCKKEEKAPTAKELKQFQEVEIDVDEIEEMPVPAWWWKPVRDKPKKPCNMLLARKDKFENWEYRVVFGNFDYFVFSWEAQCWCEIQAP